MAMLKLVTRGDMPKGDWGFLYSQYKTIPAAQKLGDDKLSYKEFKAKLKEEAPHFLYDLLYKPKSPPPLDHSKN